jgi:Response regulator receiver domain
MKTQPLRLLIVEDNVDTARMIKVLLKQEGYEARTAFDGPEAIEIARLFRPHAVLLDLTLPGMSGSEVAGELRNLPELSGCVLIAISGWDAAMLAPFDYHFPSLEAWRRTCGRPAPSAGTPRPGLSAELRGPSVEDVIEPFNRRGPDRASPPHVGE